MTDHTDRSTRRTSESAENALRECANCGTEFETGEKYPVYTEGDGTDDLRIYSFCDYRCMYEWFDQSPNERR